MRCHVVDLKLWVICDYTISLSMMSHIYWWWDTSTCLIGEAKPNIFIIDCDCAFLSWISTDLIIYELFLWFLLYSRCALPLILQWCGPFTTLILRCCTSKTTLNFWKDPTALDHILSYLVRLLGLYQLEMRRFNWHLYSITGLLCSALWWIPETV
jgi:hypothetical protein